MIGNPFELKQDRLTFFILGLFLFGVFILALGIGLFFFKSSSSDDIQIISNHFDDSINQNEIVVHVDGAIVAPGVYRLGPAARVTDAVAAAGGLTFAADQTRINLAAKVSDGQKIYVLAEGESTSIKGITSTTHSTSSGQAGITGSDLININTATESELDKLPGVGPVTAAKIIASRPYSSQEELLVKKVVSRSTLEKIKDLISLY